MSNFNNFFKHYKAYTCYYNNKNILFDFFKSRKNGTFVEVGAPTMESPSTKLLESLNNWSGIIIERDLSKFQELEETRKCVLVCENISYVNVPHFGKGLVSQTYGTSTLSKILEYNKLPKTMDILNINITNPKLQKTVFNNIVVNEYAFKFIACKTKFHQDVDFYIHEKNIEFLHENKYRIISLDEHNILFKSYFVS